jgi:DNA-binding MarR family transcriptional regulator
MTRDRTKSARTHETKVAARPSQVLPAWRIAGRIRNWHRLFNAELQRRFDSFDIKISDWMHLRNIAEEEGLTQVEIARQLRMEKASSTAVLKKLKALGLIQGKRMKSDNRKIGIYLTGKGKRLVEKLIPNVLSVINGTTAGITEKEMAAMVRTIDTMLANLDSMPNPAAATKPLGGIATRTGARRRSRATVASLRTLQK